MTDQTSPVSETLKRCPFCGCDKIEILYDHPDSVGPHLAGHYIHHPAWKTYPDSWKCWLNFGGKFDTKEAAAEAWNSRAGLAQCSQQWQPIETAPKDQEIEVRGVWKLRGDGVAFTHWRALSDTSTLCKSDPMFECPECGGDLAEEGHQPTCTGSWRLPDSSPVGNSK